MNLWRKLFSRQGSRSAAAPVTSEPVVEVPPPVPPAPANLEDLLQKLELAEPPLHEAVVIKAFRELEQFADARIPAGILAFIFHRGDLYLGPCWGAASRAFRKSSHLCPVPPLTAFLSEIPAHVPEWFVAQLTVDLGFHATAETYPVLLSLTKFARGDGNNDGTDVRKNAVYALTCALERHAANASAADLEAILAMTEPPLTVWYEGQDGWETRTELCELTKLKTLAEREQYSRHMRRRRAGEVDGPFRQTADS
jgi:hypothetical protein